MRTLWASASEGTPGARERVLPAGTTHVVFRLAGPPLRVFDAVDDDEGRVVGHAVIGGARAAYYVKDVSEPSRGVGAELRPGVAGLLLGVPAGELAGRHTALEDVLGSAAATTREQLLGARDEAAQLDILEAFLAARLPRVRGVHPAVAEALAGFAEGADVAEAVRRSGYSHRRFADLFQISVGLTPKVYCRVTRFEGLLARAGTAGFSSWADAALTAGYFDQPHLHRDFLAFAGMTPARYRALAPSWSRHVVVRP